MVNVRSEKLLAVGLLRDDALLAHFSDFNKSFWWPPNLSNDDQETVYARSENGCGFLKAKTENGCEKWHFSVRIWKNEQHFPANNS